MPKMIITVEYEPNLDDYKGCGTGGVDIDTASDAMNFDAKRVEDGETSWE